MKIIGIGTDITEISRIGRMCTRHSDHFLKRVYTERELEYSGTSKQREEHLAARWAAKEAVMKALGTGWISGIRWTDIEVCNENGGKPYLNLYGGAGEIAKALGTKWIHLTLSHSGDYAVAFVILEGND